jgi:uncharacterized damage-inducible protein DinB
VPAAAAWTPPRAGEWSAGEVVRHLVEGDRDKFLPRLRRMLAEDRPRFATSPGAEGDDADLATLLAAFADARRHVVGLLAGARPEAWTREGISPSRGALSVEAYARSTVAHDTEHLRQVQDVRAALGLPPRRAEARVALPLPEIVEAIGHTPARLEAAARGLSADQLRRRPRDEAWSMKEVMAHLLKVERDLFLPRLTRTAEEDRPAFESFDPDAWARERDHREGRFGDDLDRFAAAREETVALLASLPPAAADRLGLSAHFGPIALGVYATHVVDHDLEHLAQMESTREAVEGA